MTRKLTITILVAATALWLGAGAALAQGQPAKAAPPPGMAQPTQSYNSPLRGQCMDELRKDDAWRASLEKELRIKIHQEDSDLIANNHKHVFMAYSALWIIMVIFVVAMWVKQRSLRAEIERLQRDVERATEES